MTQLTGRITWEQSRINALMNRAVLKELVQAMTPNWVTNEPIALFLGLKNQVNELPTNTATEVVEQLRNSNVVRFVGNYPSPEIQGIFFCREMQNKCIVCGKLCHLTKKTHQYRI